MIIGDENGDDSMSESICSHKRMQILFQAKPTAPLLLGTATEEPKPNKYSTVDRWGTGLPQKGGGGGLSSLNDKPDTDGQPYVYQSGFPKYISDWMRSGDTASMLKNHFQFMQYISSKSLPFYISP